MYRSLNGNSPSGPSTAKFFRILQVLSQWNLMWIPRKIDNESRFFCLTWIAWFFVIIFGAIYSYYTYYDAYINNNLIFNIFCIITIVSIILSRIISFYYFMKYFKYPWNNILDDFFELTLKSHYIKRLTQTSIRILIYLFTYIPLTILFVTIEQINQHYYYFWENYIYWIASVFGIWIPLGISQCIISIIFLKYELFLYTIQSVINSDKKKRRKSTMNTNSTINNATGSDEVESTTGTNTLSADDVGTNFMSSLVNSGQVRVQAEEIDFGKIFMRYKKMRDEFNTTYKLWQKYMIVRMFLIFWMIWFWIENVFGNKFTKQRDVIMYIGSGAICFILPFIEFIISGMRLNEQFKSFNDTLWNYDMMTEEEYYNINDDEKFDCNTLPTINDSSANIRYQNYLQNRFDKKVTKSLLSRNVIGNRFDGSDQNTKHQIHNNWNNAYEFLSGTMFNIKDFYFILQYVNRYPFIATLFGYEVTVKNAFLLFILAVVVKLISYSILGYD